MNWFSKIPKCKICRNVFLVETYARHRGYCACCFRRAIQIEGDEWHCAGNFIQRSEHPCLVGRYEVFKDNARQTHVGRYYTFSDAKRAARQNPVHVPKMGASVFFI